MTRHHLSRLLVTLALVGFCGRSASGYNYVAVGDPASIGEYAYALNNSGQVATTSLVRSYVASDGDFSAFTEIVIPNTATSTPGVVAQGMNDAGEVVGRFRVQGNPANQTSGFVRRVDGTIDVYNFPSLASTSISEINNLGAMVGETRSDLTVFGVIRGFLYDQGNYSEISFPGSVLTRAYGINDAGDVVGQFQNDDAVSRPFLLRSGVYQELTLAAPVGGTQSALAFNISDSGLILGTYRDLANETKTWIRELDGSFTYPNLPGSGRAINDARQIAGSFLDAANGNARTAFVASVPEPATLLPAAIGMALTFIARRRANCSRHVLQRRGNR